MSFFGEDFLKGFFGADGLKDYTHASKTFRTNGYELMPRTKFLFHVFFNINTAQIPSLQAAFGNNDIATIGLMVKSIQLPGYNVSIDTMNQYNRKRLVQSKIDYQPVQVVFNDDQGDLIRYMWYMYYSYYYKDPQQKYDNATNINGSIGNLQTLQTGFDYNSRDIYSGSRQVSDWGYVGEAYQDSSRFTGSSNVKPPFFRDIKIYGLSQKKFASYVLINPLIENWQHDTYDYSQGGGTMANTVTIKYETVKYYSGYVGGSQPSNNVVGFADPDHYDTRRSSISRPGNTNTVFGQGGIVDAGAGFIQDLNALGTGRGGLASVIGAAQAANALNQARKNPNLNKIFQTELEQIKREAAIVATKAAVNSVTQNTGTSQNFPR
jgi:hypothetical protein